MGAAVEERPVIGTTMGQAEFGAGYMDDEMTPYVPSLNCLDCGRFVGRDGWIGIGHFEMSSEIAYVEGQCKRCIDRERREHPERFGLTQQSKGGEGHRG